jgi:hypothetical protein
MCSTRNGARRGTQQGRGCGALHGGQGRDSEQRRAGEAGRQGADRSGSAHAEREQQADRCEPDGERQAWQSARPGGLVPDRAEHGPAAEQQRPRDRSREPQAQDMPVHGHPAA